MCMGTGAMTVLRTFQFYLRRVLYSRRYSAPTEKMPLKKKENDCEADPELSLIHI